MAKGLRRGTAPSADCKLVRSGYGHRVEFVKSFVERWRLQPFLRSRQRPVGYRSPENALAVPFHSLPQIGRKVVADDAKSGRSGGTDIPGAVSGSDIGIVHDKRLLGRQARLDQDMLAVAPLEHIEVDTNVCIPKALRVERGLANGLNSDEEDCVHSGRYDSTTLSNCKRWTPLSGRKSVPFCVRRGWVLYYPKKIPIRVE